MSADTVARDGVFVETTVLTALLLKTGRDRQNAADAIAAYTDVLVPHYALKELKLGPLQHYWWFFDKLRQERSLSSALEALHRLSRTPQRGKASTALEVHASVTRYFGQFRPSEILKQHGDDDDLDTVMADFTRLEIKRLILKAWQLRDTIGTRYDPLECYPDAEIREDGQKLDLKPNQCPSSSRCALQRKILESPADLDSVIDALAQMPSKPENVNRRKVLREIRKRPNAPIRPDACRKIGDAYFALRCPKTVDLLTTNTKDIEPLASALGKAVKTPLR